MPDHAPLGALQEQRPGPGARASLFPFTAIVGQERMKLALLLNAIHPAIGGVLIRGEKGTAKSTAVRALAEILPDLQVVADCPFGCDPDVIEHQCATCRQRTAAGETLPVVERRMRVVELPINASEDRVVGTIDLERAIQAGEKRFEPGVLGQANRNVLYVDECNLLDDHIVDVLLDAAAMGVNTIEREGISFNHPARFILVGTMNPEEGELRPQLLDRFGLCVDIEGIREIQPRMEIARRRDAWEEDSERFERRWSRHEEALRRRIARAEALRPQVRFSDSILRLIAEIDIGLEVDGHRADIVGLKAAQARAALEGRRRITEEDVYEVAPMVLAHRLRKQPFAPAAGDIQKMILAARSRGGAAAEKTG